MAGMTTERLGSLADVIPGLREGSGGVNAVLGIQRMFSVPLGPPLLIDGATYKQVLFTAPCDGCELVGLWVSASVAISGGTNTLNFARYDASGDASASVLETDDWDPTGVTALEGSEMTLQSTTVSQLYMDKGDTLSSTLVCGTMNTDGEGMAVTVLVLVSEVA